MASHPTPLNKNLEIISTTQASFFKMYIFILFFIYVCVCWCVHTSAMHSESRREHKLSSAGIIGCCRTSDIGARNHSSVLDKSRKCFGLLNHCSSTNACPFCLFVCLFMWMMTTELQTSCCTWQAFSQWYLPTPN